MTDPLSKAGATILALTLGAMFGAMAPIVSHAANDMISRLADGSPWSITMPNGRNGSLTMMPDGTGTIGVGPMRMQLSWQPTSNGFCMNTRRNGEQCVTLTGTGNGFVGTGPDGNTMQISR